MTSISHLRQLEFLFRVDRVVSAKTPTARAVATKKVRNGL